MPDPMSWEIERQDAPPLIRVRVRGAFDVGKCTQVFDEIAEVKGSSAFFPILIDDREADLSALRPAELIDLGNLFMKYQSVFAYSKVAVLMNEGSDFDLANKFQSITSDKFVSFTIFTNEKKALKWLGP